MKFPAEMKIGDCWMKYRKDRKSKNGGLHVAARVLWRYGEGKQNLRAARLQPTKRVREKTCRKKWPQLPNWDIFDSLRSAFVAFAPRL